MLRPLLFATALLALAPAAFARDAAQTPQAAQAPAPAAEKPLDIADIPFVGAHAAAVETPSADDAWGGPRSGSEATLSDRVVRYQISAELDPDKHVVTAQEKLTWRNRSNQPVRAVFLHLYLNAFEGNDSTFMTEQRNSGFGFRSDVSTRDGEWGYTRLKSVTQDGAEVKWHYVHPDNGPASDKTVVEFDLPQPVAPGASTTLDIGFLDQLPRVVARTGYWGTFHLVGQWFPKIGVLELPGERGATQTRWNVHEFHAHSEFYADYGEYDVRLTVPRDYAVGAVGAEQGAPLEKDGKATHHFVQNDVHDFAWTADKRYAKPLEGSWQGPGSPKVAIRVLYTPENVASAAPALKATQDSLTWFSNTLGPYPYATVTVVIPPYNAEEAGGMEYPTFFTAEGYSTVEKGTLVGDLLDFVTIHEFGHGYFYGILGSNEFEEPMLDEGLNEFWDMRMLGARKQDVHLTTPGLKTWLGLAPTITGFDYERMGAMDANPSDPIGANSWDRMSDMGYNSVYSRTATTMRDLEAQLGTPALEKAFKLYYARWKFRHPSAADFRQALIDSSGQRDAIEKTFAQQVYAVRKIDDSIAGFDSHEELPASGYVERDGQPVELTGKDIDEEIDKQRKEWKDKHPHAKPADGGPYPFRTTVLVQRKGADVPQTLLVRFADGSSETMHFSGPQAWQRYSWVKPVKAVSAELDPQNAHFLDANLLDNSRTLESNGAPARRWTAALATLFKSFLALLVSLA